MESSLSSKMKDMTIPSSSASDPSLTSSMSWDDMKTKLQEYTEKENLPSPVYFTRQSIGQPTRYQGMVVVGDRSFTGSPYDTEEEAEVSAAEIALVCLGVKKIVGENEAKQGFREVKELCNKTLAGMKEIKGKFEAEKAYVGKTSDEFENLIIVADASIQCLEGSMQILMQKIALRNWDV